MPLKVPAVPGDYEETGHQGECSVKAGRVVRASGKLAELSLGPCWDHAAICPYVDILQFSFALARFIQRTPGRYSSKQVSPEMCIARSLGANSTTQHRRGDPLE